ncbi:MAG: DUF3623 family protein [Alphaproteobacteria bacterium]|nr:DUF3623 family protein [Alphaproteobacteria bacterium]
MFACGAAAALIAWWFSTGAILWLLGRSRAVQRASFIGLSVAALSAMIATPLLAAQLDLAGAYLGFAAGLVIWGWHEMSFLMGYLTGPRTAPASPGARGWRRFREAAATLMHHEIALAATGVALWLLSVGQPNQMAAATFAVLWAMRLSTKLNIHWGVANLSESFLPDRLAHLKTYFRKRAMNALMPFSLAAGAALAAWFAATAFSASDAPTTAAAALLFAIAALGFAEHVFLILKLNESALWRWAMPQPRPSPSAVDALSQARIGRER